MIGLTAQAGMLEIAHRPENGLGSEKDTQLYKSDFNVFPMKNDVQNEFHLNGI